MLILPLRSFSISSITVPYFFDIIVNIISIADFMCSMISPLFFRIVLMVEQSVLKKNAWLLPSFHLALLSHFHFCFHCYSFASGCAGLGKKDTVLLYSIQYCTIKYTKAQPLVGMHACDGVRQTRELTFMAGHANARSHHWKFETWRFTGRGLTVWVELSWGTPPLEKLCPKPYSVAA